MTEHYIGDLDKEEEKMVRRGLAVQEDAIKEIEIVNRMTREFLAGNISLETMRAAIDNMTLMSEYEQNAVDEL